MRAVLLEIAVLIFLSAASRLLPHLPNMTALSAVALKARTRFGLFGLFIPLATLVLTDLMLGLYSWKLMVSVYASFMLIGMLGTLLPKHTPASRIYLVSLNFLGATLFFLITNTVVWATSTWYPHTVPGLLTCLLAGLPFYGAMLLGDILFTYAFFRLPFVKPFVSLAPHKLTLTKLRGNTIYKSESMVAQAARRLSVIARL